MIDPILPTISDMAKELNLTQSVLLGALALSLLMLLNAVRVEIFNPLNRIPGPWYAPYTKLWLKYQTNAGRRMYYVESLHIRYGSIVRIGPNEVDVVERSAYKEINRIGSGFVKSSWYPVFRSGIITNPHDMDLLALVDPKDHSRRRKLYASNFTHDALVKNWEPFVMSRVKAAVEQVKIEAQHGPTNIFKWWNLMANEIMGKLAFGESWSLIKDGKENEFLQYIHVGTMLAIRRVEFGFLYKLVKRLDIPFMRPHFDAPVKFFNYARRAAENARNSNLQTNNIFSAVIAAFEKEAISDDVIAIEAEGLMTGGSSTVKNTMTYYIYEVLKRPEWRANIEAEVAQLPENYTVNDLDPDKLPFTNAVLYETLRYHAAAPGALRRTAPAQGAKLGRYFVPGGTTVSVQAYSLNRDPAIYSDPYKFDPYRFMNPATFQAQKAALGTFGGGTRVCIGINLAFIEMRHVAAAFFRECKGMKVAEGTNEDVMRPMEFFGMEPSGLKCEITM